VIERDVAEIKAAIASKKATGELKKKFKMYYRSGTGGHCSI